MWAVGLPLDPEEHDVPLHHHRRELAVQRVMRTSVMLQADTPTASAMKPVSRALDGYQASNNAPAQSPLKFTSLLPHTADSIAVATPGTTASSQSCHLCAVSAARVERKNQRQDKRRGL